MKNKGVFTMIPTNNDEFYNKDERLNLLHLYITERVRGFEQCGKTCYMSNEQFANETRNSISTIKRAVKLLVELNILWAGYHQENVCNKQRVLRIYNESLGEYHKSKDDEGQNEPLSENTEGQNDTLRGSNCTSERVKLTPSEVQNEPLVYKENIKSISLEEGSLRTSSRSCTRAQPSADLGTNIKRNRTKRSIATIEADYSEFESSTDDCASLNWLNNNTTNDLEI